jgi:hypothetical protein
LYTWCTTIIILIYLWADKLPLLLPTLGKILANRQRIGPQLFVFATFLKL